MAGCFTVASASQKNTPLNIFLRKEKAEPTRAFPEHPPAGGCQLRDHFRQSQVTGTRMAFPIASCSAQRHNSVSLPSPPSWPTTGSFHLSPSLTFYTHSRLVQRPSSLPPNHRPPPGHPVRLGPQNLLTRPR